MFTVLTPVTPDSTQGITTCTVMHVVLHFDMDIPAISEPAYGDLAGLQTRCVNEGLTWLCLDPATSIPSALWISIVAQLSSALDYICASPRSLTWILSQAISLTSAAARAVQSPLNCDV
jgi:hypothetical protein